MRNSISSGFLKAPVSSFFPKKLVTTIPLEKKAILVIVHKISQTLKKQENDGHCHVADFQGQKTVTFHLSPL